MPIRALESHHIESILAIQSACPEIAQWTTWDYERAAQGEMAGWVSEHPTLGFQSDPNVRDASDASSLNGFLVARRVATDMEILNFAVRPGARRNGAGAALLQSAMDWARTFAAEHAILEVRSENETALRFYERHKFQIVGRRRDYYNSPTDDALLLTAHLV